MPVIKSSNPDELIVRFSGKLLLRREIPLPEEDFSLLLANSYFTPVPSIKKHFLQTICQRCNNSKKSLLGMIPCFVCKKEHVYCRKCIEMGRVMPCQPLYEWTGPVKMWPSHDNACTWEGELTPGQQGAADRIKAAIHQNDKELLVWAVCGAGKTEMLFPGIAEGLRLGKRICIASPRTDVIRELLPRIRQAFSTVTVQGLYGGSEENEGTAQLILATTHQLMRFKHAFDVLVIDEIDAFPYHADQSLPFAAERAGKQNATTIYLTATPRQKHKEHIDSKKLDHVFVPRRFHGHPLPLPILILCRSLKKHISKNLPPDSFLKWYANRNNPDRQLLIFVPSIPFAETLSNNLKMLLADETVCSVHASDENRAEKIQQFRDLKIKTMVTTTILERGVTFPAIDVIVLDAGHSVFDEAALVQISGRAGRSPKDPSGEVLFFHDGKTNAMIQAVRSIRTMNRRGGFG